MKQKILHPQIILKISLLFWLLLYGSINIYPSNLFRIETLHDFFKTFRILAPTIVGTIIIVILLTKIFYDKQKNFISAYIYIFFAIFFFQLIGSFFTNRINFETLYVIFFFFLSIILFALLEYLKMQQSYKYFLYSLIIFILVSVVILIGLKIDAFLVGLKSFNLYNVFHPDLTLAGHAPPRSTGFSRMLAILAVFLVTFVEKKKYPLINPYNLILFFLVILILFF